MYIRLEYSQSAGHFHFSGPSEQGENTNGYITLALKIKAEQAEAFCERIRQKFPDHNNGHLASNLPLTQVQKEFQDFVDEEIKTIRENMVSFYQLRARTYRRS
jgi:hypothetical protein